MLENYKHRPVLMVLPMYCITIGITIIIIIHLKSHLRKKTVRRPAGFIKSSNLCIIGKFYSSNDDIDCSDSNFSSFLFLSHLPLFFLAFG